MENMDINVGISFMNTINVIAFTATTKKYPNTAIGNFGILSLKMYLMRILSKENSGIKRMSATKLWAIVGWT